MYSIIWLRNDRWQIFTNEIWETEKEAQNMLNEITLKRKINGKLSYMIENIIYNHGY